MVTPTGVGVGVGGATTTVLVVRVVGAGPTTVVDEVGGVGLVVPPAHAAEIQNQARSTVSCIGTVCPTFTAE